MKEKGIPQIVKQYIYDLFIETDLADIDNFLCAISLQRYLIIVDSIKEYEYEDFYSDVINEAIQYCNKYNDIKNNNVMLIKNKALMFFLNRLMGKDENKEYKF